MTQEIAGNFYYTSDLKIAGFILDIHPNEPLPDGMMLLDALKQEILFATKDFSDEDMICIYQEDMDVAMGRAEIVAEISNYPYESIIDFHKAIVNVSRIFSELDQDFKYKNIVIFSNRLSEGYIHSLSKAMKLNRLGIVESIFTFFEVGSKLNLKFKKYCLDEEIGFMSDLEELAGLLS